MKTLSMQYWGGHLRICNEALVFVRSHFSHPPPCIYRHKEGTFYKNWNKPATCNLRPSRTNVLYKASFRLLNDDLPKGIYKIVWKNMDIATSDPTPHGLIDSSWFKYQVNKNITSSWDEYYWHLKGRKKADGSLSQLKKGQSSATGIGASIFTIIVVIIMIFHHLQSHHHSYHHHSSYHDHP